MRTTTAALVGLLVISACGGSEGSEPSTEASTATTVATTTTTVPATTTTLIDDVVRQKLTSCLNALGSTPGADALNNIFTPVEQGEAKCYDLMTYLESRNWSAGSREDRLLPIAEALYVESNLYGAYASSFGADAIDAQEFDAKVDDLAAQAREIAGLG